MDRGAWWAAIYGVAQKTDTRLVTADHTDFFFFLQVSLVERGKKTLQIHIGQGSVGQQIKPEDRLFELSGRKKDCPGTELK